MTNVDQSQNQNSNSSQNPDPAKTAQPPVDTTKTVTSVLDPKALAEPKPGDLLSAKKADGTDKTAEEVAADKTAHEKAEADKVAGDAPIALDNIKAPEGIDLKSPLAKEFIDLLNNKDLKPAERPQALVDLVGKLKQDYDDKAAQAWLDMNTQWQAELEKTYGGEAKLEEVASRIGTSIKAFSTDQTEQWKAAGNQGNPPSFEKDLRQALTLTGAGNHPAIVKYLDWCASQVSEGTPLGGGTPPGGQKTPADRIYDKT